MRWKKGLLASQARSYAFRAFVEFQVYVLFCCTFLLLTGACPDFSFWSGRLYFFGYAGLASGANTRLSRITVKQLEPFSSVKGQDAGHILSTDFYLQMTSF